MQVIILASISPFKRIKESDKKNISKDYMVDIILAAKNHLQKARVSLNQVPPLRPTLVKPVD